MTPHEARDLVLGCLAEVAPDTDPASVPPDADLREELDLDSIDFQSYLARVSDRSGLPIDEDERRGLTTVAACVSFLARERR